MPSVAKIKIFATMMIFATLGIATFVDSTDVFTNWGPL